MANLPPRPDFRESPPRRYTPDDRYPPVSRPLPMAHQDRYYSRRDDRDTMDHYPPRSPPRTRHQDYRSVYSYDSRHEDNYHDPVHHRSAWPKERETPTRGWNGDYDSRGAWPSEPDRRQDRRGWEREPNRARDWRNDHGERRSVYERDRGHSDTRQWTRDSQQDRRWKPRASVSPPRRVAESSTRYPSRSPRRPLSPNRSNRSHYISPARSASRSVSRAPSPSRKVRLGNHSISTSPCSPRGRYDNNDRDQGMDDWRPRSRYSRSASPPRRPSRHSSRSRERDSRPVISENPERHPDVPSPLQPKLTSTLDVNASHKSRSRSHSPPVKSEISITHVPSTDEPYNLDKGKGKEQIDITMHDPLPSPPKQPRATIPTQPRTHVHSPPRGPRNYVKTPTTPASPASPYQQPVPSKPDWGRPGFGPAAAGSAPAISSPQVQTNPEATVVPLPVIPAYRPRPNVVLDLEGEIGRIQAHRAHLASDHANIVRAKRRALHELDMAVIDLRVAENRRKVADAQMEKARTGALGIDYVQTPP